MDSERSEGENALKRAVKAKESEHASRVEALQRESSERIRQMGASHERAVEEARHALEQAQQAHAAAAQAQTLEASAALQQALEDSDAKREGQLQELQAKHARSMQAEQLQAEATLKQETEVSSPQEIASQAGSTQSAEREAHAGRPGSAGGPNFAIRPD